MAEREKIGREASLRRRVKEEDRSWEMIWSELANKFEVTVGHPSGGSLEQQWFWKHISSEMKITEGALGI